MDLGLFMMLYCAACAKDRNDRLPVTRVSIPMSF